MPLQSPKRRLAAIRFDLPRHLVDLGHAVDRAQDAAVTVIRQDRRRLIAIDLEPRLDRLRPVVGPTHKLGAAANVADAVDSGR